MTWAPEGPPESCLPARRRRLRPLFSYRRFKTDERLHKELDQWLFLPTIEVLDAYLAFLDACHPLDKISWLDSNAREKPADADAAAVADGAEPVPKRRKCG